MQRATPPTRFLPRLLLRLAALLLLPLAALAQTGAPEIAPSAVTLTVHVATTGNDNSGNGSSAAPFRTIKRGLSAASSLIASQQTGVRVLVAPGVYLEAPQDSLTTISLSYPTGGYPLVLEGAGWSPGVHTGDVILTGAQPHGGWVANGDGTHTAPWPHTLPRLNPAQIGVGPGVSYPEVVGRMERLFVNDQAYLQVEAPPTPSSPTSPPPRAPSGSTTPPRPSPPARRPARISPPPPSRPPCAVA